MCTGKLDSNEITMHGDDLSSFDMHCAFVYVICLCPDNISKHEIHHPLEMTITSVIMITV